MGLLTALDFHSELETAASKEGTEVEYRLYSWGEIYPPFLGDREHSIAARYILQDFPFKLFSSSKPYDDPLPQKLSLTFKAPYEIKKDTEHLHTSGIFPHEIAHEFAAFLSVVTRRRVFVSKQTRYDGLPLEQEADIYVRSHSQERQRLREIEPAQIYRLLRNLQSMDRYVADGFVLAMRLYHAAVQMLYTEPEFAYLFLVTCLEAVSSVVYKDYRPKNTEQFLDSRFSGWRAFAKLLPPEQENAFTKLLLGNEHYTFRKLAKFVEEYLPESFWSETEDDAKPDYLFGIIEPGPDGRGRERIEHSGTTLEDYEKIKKKELETTLRNIYSARSNLVHQGMPFPASIVVGHFRQVPLAAFDELMEIKLKRPTSNPRPAIPPLLTFEKLVSLSLVSYLMKH
jgi:hypothetical protein